MQKAKLGISVGLLGAGLYFLGAISFLGLIILAGYVLIFESNEWLKKSAVKAVAIVIGFSLIGVIVGLGSDIFNFLNQFLSYFTSFRLNYPLHLNEIIISAANALQTIILLILGFRSFSQGDLKVSVIDKVVDKNF